MSLRPRDRKPIAVDVTVTSMRGELCWLLTELMPPHGKEPARRADVSARPEPARVG